MSAPWTVHCDGSAVPNPGRMGLGAVLVAPDGTRHTLSQAAEGRGCNNEAEVRALIAALALLRSHAAADVLIHCDNSIVVEQLTRSDAPPVARLAGFFDEARHLLASFPQARVVWLPRHRNTGADALARAALGLAPKAAGPARQRRR